MLLLISLMASLTSEKFSIAVDMLEAAPDIEDDAINISLTIIDKSELRI